MFNCPVNYWLHPFCPAIVIVGIDNVYINDDTLIIMFNNNYNVYIALMMIIIQNIQNDTIPTCKLHLYCREGRWVQRQHIPKMPGGQIFLMNCDCQQEERGSWSCIFPLIFIVNKRIGKPTKCVRMLE